jgi:hypothetical protein
MIQSIYLVSYGLAITELNAHKVVPHIYPFRIDHDALITES